MKDVYEGPHLEQLYAQRAGPGKGVSNGGTR